MLSRKDIQATGCGRLTSVFEAARRLADRERSPSLDDESYVLSWTWLQRNKMSATAVGASC